MIATHTVKINGKWYSAGMELPNENTSEKVGEKAKRVRQTKSDTVTPTTSTKKY